ncbi:MAG: carbohydrate kinase [Pseudolysinimonas sp.]|uniref:carbohydrate kinase family protein n=1 Tax=Pseudolysinimonas sp. TaxID=2680009 RepID=UPI0032647610
MSPVSSTGALVIGEALVDIVHRVGQDDVALPGGSPLNVAVGLARLGIPTMLHAAFGTDVHGQMVADHLVASGVIPTRGTVGTAATSVAEATIDVDGGASYDFRIAWDPAPIDARGYDLVHTGSIGAALDPGAARVEAALATATGLVSFDPNIRPALMPEDALARVERIVALSDVVKASDEDLAWLYPGASVDDVLVRWFAFGPRLVVVTRGDSGADALSADGRAHIEAPPTTVADTIGAGDSFMAGLLTHVLERGFGEIQKTLAFASRCAAITVSRPGADPPWRAEL